MDTIEILTLIDITNTKVIRPSQGSQLELDQQRNFITLLQCVEIRSIIDYKSGPKFNVIDIKKLGFGQYYKGKQKIWTFEFQTDRDNVYADNEGNPVGNLIEDLNEVPIIKKLTETINIDKSIFDCKDPLMKNTIIRLINQQEIS